MKNLNKDQISSLSKFKNLKSLKLIESDIPAFPNELISKMENLEILSLWKFSKLTSLPLELSNLSKLNRVEIIDCNNIDNIFAFLSNASRLSSIRTDLNLSKEQQIALKAKFPKLEIEEMLVEDGIK